MSGSKTQAKLDLIEHIKAYGESLGLDFNDAFSKYNFETKPVKGYSLEVVLKDSMDSVERKFIIDDKGDGLKRVKVLSDAYKAQGYETFYYEAPAWGSKDCQISDTLVSLEDSRLIYFLLHEGWHLTSKLSRLNLALEESIANAVGELGRVGYCKDCRLGLLEAAMLEQEENMLVGRFIIKYFDLLANVPKDDLGGKDKVISESKKESHDLIAKMKSAAKWNLCFEFNNAFFYYSNKYYRHYELISKLIKKLGLKPAIGFIKGYWSDVECLCDIHNLLNPGQ